MSKEYKTINGKLEHRIIYERNFGKIKNNWEVHHIDMNKHNNNLENLIALPKLFHVFIHKFQRTQNRIIYRKEIEFYLLKYQRERNNKRGVVL